MNETTMKHLDVLGEDIHNAIARCAGAMAQEEADQTMQSGMDALASMISVVSHQHQSVIWTMIGTLLEMNKDQDMAIPHSALRKTVDHCISEFTNDLKENIVQSSGNLGLPNIFDPNIDVREELLNDNV